MKSKKLHDRYATIALLILFTILAILIILPIYALFIASFKPGGRLITIWTESELES